MSSLRQDDVDWTAEAPREFLDAIDEETDRLTALVGNLLDMSRLQAGALEPQLRAVAFDEVVPAALASLGAGGATRRRRRRRRRCRGARRSALLERAVANLSRTP